VLLFTTKPYIIFYPIHVYLHIIIQLGDAVADVFFGDQDFVAATPYTWRRTFDGDVIYPFGFGLTKNEIA
jgi:hypothetical protein